MDLSDRLLVISFFEEAKLAAADEGISLDEAKMKIFIDFIYLKLLGGKILLKELKILGRL